MKVIFCDVPDDGVIENINNTLDAYVVNACAPSARCRGCFQCWTKTPGKCVINDKLEGIGSMAMQAEEFIIISECVYGGYSENIKKVLDRCIPGVMPFFTQKDGQMNHTQRFDHRIKLKVYFYGDDITIKERNLAKKVVKRNALNMWAKESEVYFVERQSLSEVKL